jgi:hypothetical protein
MAAGRPKNRLSRLVAAPASSYSTRQIRLGARSDNHQFVQDLVVQVDLGVARDAPSGIVDLRQSPRFATTCRARPMGKRPSWARALSIEGVPFLRLVLLFYHCLGRRSAQLRRIARTRPSKSPLIRKSPWNSSSRLELPRAADGPRMSVGSG